MSLYIGLLSPPTHKPLPPRLQTSLFSDTVSCYLSLCTRDIVLIPRRSSADLDPLSEETSRCVGFFQSCAFFLVIANFLCSALNKVGSFSL
jgi:hypothetical protein